MILLDTHIWVWLVSDTQHLRPRQRELLDQHETGGLGVSIISCWEVEAGGEGASRIAAACGRMARGGDPSSAHHFALADA